MKKKVIASTLSLSLVLGSIAGLPLSNKGILEKVGVGTANAAVPGLSSITDELNNIHSFLWTEEEKDSIRKVRDNVKNLANDPANEELVSEIAVKIRAKINTSNGSYDRLTKKDVLKLFGSLGLFFDPSGTELTNLLSDPNVRPILEQLANLGGSSLKDLTIQDAADFAKAANDAIIKQLENKSLAELAALALNQQAMKDEIKSAIVKVMGSNNKFSQMLSSIGITGDDLAAVTNKIIAKADPDRSGTTMVALALLRSKTAVAITNEYGSNSQKQSYNVSVLGKTVPGIILALKSSNSNISVSSVSDKIVVSTTLTGTVSSEISGLISAPGTYLDGKLLFKQPVTLTYTPSGGGSTSRGGGGGGGVFVTPSQPEAPIKDLANAIQEATGEKKEALLEKAKATAEEAIAKLAVLDLTASVTVTDGKATAKLDVADVLKQIQNVSAEIKKITDALSALDSSTPKPVVEMTLNLGAMNVNQFEAPIAKEILDAAKDNGITSLNLKLGELSVAIDPKAFNAQTTLNVEKKSVNEANQATTLPIASGVYEINFTSNGTPVTGFTKPVELRLPVDNESRFDVEKLSLAKIIDGKLQFFGGKYSPADKQLKAKRNSFSTYTVVENNVTFNDIASVKDWAGRQIEVAAAKGILEGRSDGEFVPNGTITRAEFAKLIVNTFGLEDVSATSNFEDVHETDWFKPYVAAAVKSGLVNGRTDTKFDPNGKITRAEMATIAARALTTVNQTKAVSDVDGTLKVFSDAGSINESLKAGVALSVAQRIIIGEEGGKFNPNAESTRAQAAVIIYRLLNK